MSTSKRIFITGLFCGLFLSTLCLRAAIPSPEKLLPEDTLVLLTAPDFAKLSQASAATPQVLLWNDPAMKPFKEKFLNKWNEEFLTPLERELDIKVADYTSLLQGQLTFAIIQNGWKGQAGEEPGLLLLVDTKDKSDQLKKNLGDLRKKCSTSGRTVRTEKIRDVDFLVLPISSNDVPKTLRKFFPKSSDAPEEGEEKHPQKADKKDEVVIGQSGSLLILANSVKAAEGVVVRLGGSAPSLADFAPYQANHLALFRDAPLYGWINVKTFMNVLLPVLKEKKGQEQNPLDVAPEKAFNALGLSALKTVSATVRQSAEGALVEIFLGVPESTRQGLFKILAGEAKEATPPPFVPAEVVKFQRWRIDGQKTWATLQQAVGEISPQAVNALNFMLDSANTYAREKDPAFDIRKNLIGNFGDDIISYEKKHSEGADPLASGPSLVLLSSPNAEQFVAALKSVLVFMNQQTAPQEREFLGRKIFSIPLAFPGRPASSKNPVLHYGATKGYVAFSTDASMVEEYFRTSEGNPAKPLREIAGLAEAAQKVAGPASSLFGYENDVESMRIAIDLLRKTSTDSSFGAGLFSAAVGLGGSEKTLKEWLDFSLLPPFEKISKYFHFSVYGGSASVEGLTFKMFTPVPPALKP